MPLPSTMQHIAVDASGTLYLTTSPMPQPRAHELLIRVMAAGVNRPDLAQRKGAYPPPADASPILGLEAAGEVIAVGEAVTTFVPGDSVCALTNGGAYAEYCVAPASQCLPWPTGYDAIHAAALPENYFTVWVNVFMQGRLKPGESLLVHGGSSGIGITAIQLAHAFNSQVYATAGTTEKCQACLRYGADGAVNYRDADFLSFVHKVTDNHGVDMVLDMVGAAYFAKNLQCLALDGRLIEIATQQGAIVEQLDLRAIMKKRLVITGSQLRPRSTAEKGAIAAALHKEVWPLLTQGLCRPVIYQTFPLSAVNQAHQLMESSQHIGKIILKL